ncbi:MAG: tRNA (N(6)-L-threonylcarbamoyladenosine(37)-C(2))-methylthiotransferase MtaB [Candidatus Hydrogenedentes bacterium]|nr:tRNA (N(6)-L-threonylcarbamoyladenosine(37)-C(2))-methylthiotransferase MtaB [Candidatus Hydrogenedentota bacterium]
MSTVNCQLSTEKRATVHTLGCRLNQSESAILEEKLRADGYTLVPFGQPADLAIVNTCTVTNEADAKSRKLVRQFIRNNPGAYTAVIGCYAQMGAKTLASIPGVDLIIGNQEKLNVLDYVKAGKNETPLVIRDRIDRDDFLIEFGDENTPLSRRANLKVQDGCDFMCSFCIIPFARGRARAREWGNLLDEARSLVDRGAKEIILTGVNIGTYNLEGRNILHIVDALNEIEGLHRIRISSIEPTTIPGELFDRMNDPAHALLPYLHIPLQAGSDNILTAMRRKYTRQEFLDFIFHAHDAVPGIGIGTDILVGFPGEADQDFEHTCDALWKSPLVYAHVFKYSERHGAASTRIPHKVPPQTINERAARLRKLSADKTRMFCEHQIGQTQEVLFEQAQDGFWTGYTGNYTRVAAESGEDLTNEMRRVKLEEVRGDLVFGQLNFQRPQILIPQVS